MECHDYIYATNFSDFYQLTPRKDSSECMSWPQGRFPLPAKGLMLNQCTLIYSPWTQFDVSCSWLNTRKSMGGEVHGQVWRAEKLISLSRLVRMRILKFTLGDLPVKGNYTLYLNSGESQNFRGHSPYVPAGALRQEGLYVKSEECMGIRTPPPQFKWSFFIASGGYISARSSLKSS